MDLKQLIKNELRNYTNIDDVAERIMQVVYSFALSDNDFVSKVKQAIQPDLESKLKAEYDLKISEMQAKYDSAIREFKSEYESEINNKKRELESLKLDLEKAKIEKQIKEYKNGVENLENEE